MKVIKSIDVVDNFLVDGHLYEGYCIRLESGDMLAMLINNAQYCCEHSGHISPQDDDLDYFIGSAINKIEFVTGKSSGYEIIDAEDYSDGNVAFIKIFTSKGELVLAVYNIHNGYYGHDIIFIDPFHETIESVL